MVLILLLLVSVSFAQNSSIILVNIESNQKLTWKVYSSEGQLASTVTGFGELGDHLMPGVWSEGSLALIQEGDNIEWKIRDEKGEVKTIYHGKRKDILVGGGDFNGDGFHDPLRIRGNNMVWIAKGVGKTKLGNRKTDEPFFINLDGSRDRVAILRRNRILTRDIVTGESSTIVLRKSFTKAPLPIKQKNGKDLFAFIESSDPITKVFLIRRDGRPLRRRSVQANGTVIVGDFLSSDGEEIAIQSNSGFEVINPRSGSSRSLSLPSGIPVDMININSFVHGGSCSNENRSPNDGNEGFLWKPVSDTTGKLVVLLPSSLTGKVSSVKLLKDSLDETGRLSSIANGNREHYRFNKSGSEYPNNLKVVISLKTGCTINYTIPNTGIRWD